jgi:hypothetical protein
MNVQKPTRRLLLVVLGIVAVASVGVAQQPMLSAPEVRLRMAMRHAWDVHARWTRSYIVSLLADLPDSGRVKTRLFEGANDLADVMRPYCPVTAIPELANLVRQNVLATGRAAVASRAGDSLAATTALGGWSAGTDSLAQFLARTNPSWPDSKLGDLLRAYQEQTWRQIAARARQDWFADVAACDQADIEARTIADALSAGIVKQFPGKFR